jgi:hypothetical protein
MYVLSLMYSYVAVCMFCAVRCLIIICCNFLFSNYWTYVFLIYFLCSFSSFVCLFSILCILRFRTVFVYCFVYCLSFCIQLSLSYFCTRLALILQMKGFCCEGCDTVDNTAQSQIFLTNFTFKIMPYRKLLRKRNLNSSQHIKFKYFAWGGKQWQTTPENVPRMQRTRAIPVAWLGSVSCPNWA